MDRHTHPTEGQDPGNAFEDGSLRDKRVQWGIPVRIDNLVDPRWVEQALERDLREFLYCQWQTDTDEIATDTLARILPEDMQVIRRSTLLRSKVQRAVIETPSALVCLEIAKGHAWAGVAAKTLGHAHEVVDRLDPLFPEPAVAEGPQELFVRVQVLGSGFDEPLVPRLTVEPWADVAPNYAPATRTALEALMGDGFTPGEGGRLVIWHGEPGTGKSYAAATLAYEWRDWCRTKVVTDPEALLNDTGYLLRSVLDDERRTKHPWSLVVLEDTGELFTADAKVRTGQALSRLLNITDGMLGRGSKLLVLITTNEPVACFHDAVIRPGRCAARIEFEPLPVAESKQWLVSRGAVEAASAVNGPATIAELHAIADGRLEPTSRRAPIGFVAG
jgi:hypothetical protein